MTRRRFVSPGSNFKTVTCIKCGEEVSKRSTIAVDYKGAGRTMGLTKNAKPKKITKAFMCGRACRKHFAKIRPVKTTVKVPVIKSAPAKKVKIKETKVPIDLVNKWKEKNNVKPRS